MRTIVLGGGGHALVLIDAMHPKPVAVLDAQRRDETILGVPILGGDDLLDQLIAAERLTHFAVGVGAIGRTDTRQRLYDYGLAQGLSSLTVVHRTAVCAESAIIGAGAQIFAAAVVNPLAQIGNNTIINTGAMIEHECIVGNHVVVASGAILSGSVLVGEGSFIGAGATIIQGVSIGKAAIIGAGAVVLTDVPSGETVVGVPARPVQEKDR
jgi:UDP-perosamine 4-acetyltransferase